MNLFLFIIIGLILLGFSAFFSGSETAFFSLSSFQREDLLHSPKASDRRVLDLLSHPHRLLITILVGNTLVNTTLASLAAWVTAAFFRIHNWPESAGILIDVVLITFLVLVVGEITPKIAAVKNNLSIARKVSILLNGVVFLLTPVVYILDQITKMMSLPAQRFRNRMSLSGKDFQILVEVSERSHVLKDSEQKLLQSVFDFTETTVREIMIPRVDMVALDVRVPPKAAIDLIQKERYSRVPIFENDLDHIIGILYAKDLIPYLQRMNELVSLRTIVRPVYLVPESKMIDELLQEFQKKNIHLAIVVDEFGGTAGLVTLEDILEELVGDIEGDPVISTELIKPLPEGTYQLDPRIPLDDFNEKFHAFLKKDEGFETLSGYLLYRLGRLPKENEPIRAGRFCFRVTRIEGPRILEIQMELRKPLRKPSQAIDQ